MKLLYFTTELTPNLINLDNVTVGIIGNQELPQDDIKRIPALKLIKAMKQMTNKDEYEVMGDTEYVKASERLGFKAKEEAVEPVKDIEPSELAQIVSRLLALDIKYGNAQKLEADLIEKHQKELLAEREKMKSEIKKIKKVIKKIIKE